ncbi:MAG: SAM-dependent methyltransferase, partial [Thermodesulfobacteriota bacterium]
TFSERWFPPKVISLWSELHPFERMGLVLEYYRKARFFSDLHTESVRGYLRPAEDKYSTTIPFSDPVYAVWGFRS